LKNKNQATIHHNRRETTMTALIMAMRPFPRLSSSWFLLWTSLALLVGSSLSQIVLQVGDTVPDVKFFTRTRVASDPGEFEWTIRSSDDYFANKRVVLFALPGAFTPTCSAAHLPGYEDAYLDMRALGVDEVYCTSLSSFFCRFNHHYDF
jgi:Redoxin